VGFGTKMANGCTSGHGVCGLPRLSKRSIAATMTFMASGVGIATLRYHFSFFYYGSSFGDHYEKIFFGIRFGVFIAMTIGYVLLMLRRLESEYLKCFIFGVVFGIGLLLSGMCRMSKIYGFLTINTDWDPSLMFVMLSAVSINFVTFHLIMKRSSPIDEFSFNVPSASENPDKKLFVGSFIFGLGWGISGLCPGPGLINLFQLTHVIVWTLAMAVGMLSQEFIAKKLKKVGGKYSMFD